MSGRGLMVGSCHLPSALRGVLPCAGIGGVWLRAPLRFLALLFIPASVTFLHTLLNRLSGLSELYPITLFKRSVALFQGI